MAAEQSHRNESAARTGPPIKVLNVIGGLDPRAGGPSSSAQTIWISVQRAGVLVSAVYTEETLPSSAESAITGRLRRDGVTLHPFKFSPGPRKFRRWGVSAAMAIWLVRSARHYDVIHAHSAWMFSSIFALVVGRLTGKATVLTPHESLTNFDIGKDRRLGKHLLKRLIKRLHLALVDCILVSSNLELRDSLEGASDGKGVALFHPVFDERSVRMNGGGRPAPAAGRERLRVGYIGRFDPKKNLEMIIRAVARVPGAELIVAGSGTEDYDRRLKALAKDCGASQRIRWLGFVSARERDEFYASLDVLAMPSAYECFGMVAAEAIVAGVPVIVSQSTGIAELVSRHGCGVVIEATDDTLEAALSRLDADRAGLQDLARRTAAAATDLSFATYGTRLASVYARLVAEKAANGALMPANPGDDSF